MASPEPLPQFPGTPTIAASGLPGFEASIWYGLVARTAVPETVVARLHTVITGILADPQVREQMLSQGTFAIGDTLEAFQRTIDRDVRVLGDLVRQARIATPPTSSSAPRCTGETRRASWAARCSLR